MHNDKRPYKQREITMALEPGQSFAFDGQGYTVLQYLRNAKSGAQIWLCLCLCGAEFEAQAQQIPSVRRTCGCFQTFVKVNGKMLELSKAKQASGIRGSEIRRRRSLGWSWDKTLNTVDVVEPKKSIAMVTVFGEKLSVSEAVRKYGVVSRQAVYDRVNAGMGWEEALTKGRS